MKLDQKVNSDITQMRERPMTEQEKKEYMREQESRFVSTETRNSLNVLWT